MHADPAHARIMILLKGPFLILTCNLRYPYDGQLCDKESACSAGDLGSIPGLRRSPGGGNGYPLQYSCLENPMDRGAW